MLGPMLDSGRGPARWEKWRPTVDLCRHEDLLVARLDLLYHRRFATLAKTIHADIRRVSPETEVRLTAVEIEDPWDLALVYGALHDHARAAAYDPEREDVLVHITTGTHIAQICMFLLTESRHLPARLLQTGPPRGGDRSGPGTYAVIDLDLSRYDRLAGRFQEERRQGASFLKAGIETRNAAFNALIDRIEEAALRSRAPILLTGPTGAGKSALARRIYELKRERRQLQGEFVPVNCATLRGDAAMSTLFGHAKGAFTGAASERTGLLRRADGGLVLLDEIGALGLDEQAMLLKALEEKAFLPLGADREARSDFQLIAGTNEDLGKAVGQGRFREDLLARIHLWSFRLPSLRERPEDLAPNLDFELERWARESGARVALNREARERFLAFAASGEALWTASFRDFNAAVTRMATLATGGRIDIQGVEDEIRRLQAGWAALSGEAPLGEAGAPNATPGDDLVARALGEAGARALDRFDRVQLADVLQVVRDARSLSEAGRALFAGSLSRRTTVNDADRLKKYLARMGIDARSVRGA